MPTISNPKSYTPAGGCKRKPRLFWGPKKQGCILSITVWVSKKQHMSERCPHASGAGTVPINSARTHGKGVDQTQGLHVALRCVHLYIYIYTHTHRPQRCDMLLPLRPIYIMYLFVYLSLYIHMRQLHGRL